MSKIPVGIIGATGMVGQKYIQLLENHPWFEVALVAASPRSEDKEYQESVYSKWQMPTPIPESIKKQKIISVENLFQRLQNQKNLNDYLLNKNQANFPRLIFSCFEMSDKELVKKYETDFAKLGFAVVSNASANRWTEDVPMLLPEINTSHLEILKTQKKNRGFVEGLIVVKPNCSVQSYLTPIYALEEAGYPVSKVLVTTMQAVSGAGYPGVSSLDMIDNLVPLINGEEDKTEKEPLKILGKVNQGKFQLKSNLKISATCTRVPIVDGHTATVSLKFANKKPSLEEIKKIWSEFHSYPQKANLPSAPQKPIIYTQEENRPQPRKDRNNDKGMAVTIGRLRECQVLDIKFIGLSHNTVRGAAGGGILNAEVIVDKGYLQRV